MCLYVEYECEYLCVCDAVVMMKKEAKKKNDFEWVWVGVRGVMVRLHLRTNPKHDHHNHGNILVGLSVNVCGGGLVHLHTRRQEKKASVTIMQVKVCLPSLSPLSRRAIFCDRFSTHVPV